MAKTSHTNLSLFLILLELLNYLITLKATPKEVIYRP